MLLNMKGAVTEFRKGWDTLLIPLCSHVCCVFMTFRRNSNLLLTFGAFTHVLYLADWIKQGLVKILQAVIHSHKSSWYKLIVMTSFL